MDPHNPIIERTVADSAQRFCRDCKHYVGADCTHPGNMKLSVVRGVPVPINTPELLREFESRPSNGTKICGPSGSWWEAK